MRGRTTGDDGGEKLQPFRRKVRIRIIQTIAVFAGMFVLLPTLYVVWFVNGKPNPAVDYFLRVNQMGRSEIPPEDNAYTHYEKAFASYIVPDERTAELIDAVRQDLLVLPAVTELTEDKRQAIGQWIGEWVQANEPAWKHFLAGSERRHYVPDYDSPLDDEIEEPWLFEVRIPSEGLREMAELSV